jgi:hypothetical protein
VLTPEKKASRVRLAFTESKKEREIPHSMFWKKSPKPGLFTNNVAAASCRIRGKSGKMPLLQTAFMNNSGNRKNALKTSVFHAG